MAQHPVGWPVRMGALLLRYGQSAGFEIRVLGIFASMDALPSADGYIAAVYKDSLAALLQQSHRPVVNIDGALPHLPFPRVGIDFGSTARLAAGHLAAQGASHLTMVYCPERTNNRVAAAAFVESATEAGLPSSTIAHPMYWWGGGDETPQNRQSIAVHDRRITAALRALPAGAGVYVWSETITQRIRELCPAIHPHPQGLRLLSGVDDPSLAQARPSITAIRQPDEDFACIAVDLMGRMLHGEVPPLEPILLRNQSLMARASTTGGGQDDATAKVLDWLDGQGFGAVSIDALAAEVGVNRRTLERRFRATVGDSIHAFHDRRRLAYAQQALSQGLAVQEIAVACGFQQGASFARWFRQHTGQPPRQARSAGRLRAQPTQPAPP